MVKVHYIFDPMCGWCYGATSLAETVAKSANVELIMHPGGMIDNKALSAEFKQQVLTYDKQIAKITGQSFGLAYQNRISGNKAVIVDSYITAQAIHAVQIINGRGFEMLKNIQAAHYQEGLDTTKPELLTQLATDLGVDVSHWHEQMKQAKNEINDVIRKTHLLMDKCRVQGFPTFVLENENGLLALDHTKYYSDISGWEKIIQQAGEV